MKTFAGTKVMTPPFRMSFPHLLKPQQIKKQDPKYSVAMLFPEDADLSKLKKAAKAAAKEKFGKATLKGLKTPFRDQEEKDFEGYEPGCIFITATSERKPGIVDEDVEDVIDPSEVYPGRWAQATVNAYGWEYGGKEGVSFGLQNIQLLDHDENLSGGASAKSDFGDDSDDDDDDDFMD